MCKLEYLRAGKNEMQEPLKGEVNEKQSDSCHRTRKG